MECHTDFTISPRREFKLQRSRDSIVHTLVLSFFFLFLVLVPGCGTEPPPVEKPAVPKPAIQKQRPANFVVCIDNSKSIKGQEQVLIREATMLLADLAEENDRISVITFGKKAHLIASTHIRSDQDRIKFKNQVRQGVDFSENYSDIRAAIKFLSEDPNSPLKQSGADTHVIILSDGKLEPADKNTRRAFREMKEILGGALEKINIHAVVLGNTYCNDVILPPNLTGLILMRDLIAKSPDRFFHAERLDQLLKIAVSILSSAKGITSLGEKESSNQFKVDNSVETMTLIVRKRSTDGSVLCRSSDIIMNKPKTEAVDHAESIYRSSDYRYFDLIVVRNPREGMWSVELANGNKPEVLSKIVTPLELRFSFRHKYYLNESATMSAWIFDKRTSQVVSEQPFTIKAHLAKGGNLENSHVYADFHTDPNSGQYYLEVPEEMLKLFESEGQPATLTMELIAQRFKSSSEEIDPWFVRRSPPVTIEFVEPFVKWDMVATEKYKIPFLDIPLNFGATLNTGKSNCPGFEALPIITHQLQRYDHESNSFQSVTEKVLEGTGETGKVLYQTGNNIVESGTYHYRYTLAGTQKLGGLFSIKSPWYKFTIKPICDGPICWIILILILGSCICLISGIRAKMKGKDKIKHYEDDELVRTATISVRTKKHGDSDNKNCFVLIAKKICCIRSYVIFSVIKGEAQINGKPLREGDTQKLIFRKKYVIVIKENGRTREHEIKIEKVTC